MFVPAAELYPDVERARLEAQQEIADHYQVSAFSVFLPAPPPDRPPNLADAAAAAAQQPDVSAPDVPVTDVPVPDSDSGSETETFHHFQWAQAFVLQNRDVLDLWCSSVTRGGWFGGGHSTMTYEASAILCDRHFEDFLQCVSSDEQPAGIRDIFNRYYRFANDPDRATDAAAAPAAAQQPLVSGRNLGGHVPHVSVLEDMHRSIHFQLTAGAMTGDEASDAFTNYLDQFGLDYESYAELTDAYEDQLLKQSRAEETLRRRVEESDEIWEEECAHPGCAWGIHCYDEADFDLHPLRDGECWKASINPCEGMISGTECWCNECGITWFCPEHRRPGMCYPCVKTDTFFEQS